MAIGAWSMLRGDPILAPFWGVPRGAGGGRRGTGSILSPILGTPGDWIGGDLGVDLGVDLRLNSHVCEHVCVCLYLSPLSRTPALARVLSLSRALSGSLSLALSLSRARPQPRLLPDLRELPLQPLR